MQFRRALAGALGAAILFGFRDAGAQDLGHKLPGIAGLDAGLQPAAGLYLADRFIYYHAGELRDRNGDPIAVGLQLDAASNAFGAILAIELEHALYFDAALAVPIGHVSLSTDDPRASVDRFGLADIFVRPFGIGWRGPHVDLVTSYGFYAPTGQLGRGIAKSQWSHQFSLGGTVFPFDSRSWRLTLLGSYDLFHQKPGIEVTRGDMTSLQGGAGATLFDIIDVGVVAYALWQVRSNRGADLPPALRDVDDRVFGIGAEVEVALRSIRSAIGARWVHDLGARSRPQGDLLVADLSFLLWRPSSALQ